MKIHQHFSVYYGTLATLTSDCNRNKDYVKKYQNALTMNSLSMLYPY